MGKGCKNQGVEHGNRRRFVGRSVVTDGTFVDRYGKRKIRTSSQGEQVRIFASFSKLPDQDGADVPKIGHGPVYHGDIRER